MSQTIRPFYFNTLLHYQHTPQQLSLLTSETVAWPPCCVTVYHHSIAKKYSLILVKIRPSFQTEIVRRNT